ncbi:FAD-binding oxidoreductase [Gammaproteobacteria bacterium]|nr:FAD-binding oxidoreductase [Gammaproteobacteria bacterium]
MKAAIVGAGLSGLLLAYRLELQGVRVTIFEKNSLGDISNCAWVAAGMLSPLAESITGEKIIYHLGMDSLPLWHNWLSDLGRADIIKQTGSIVLAHAQDRKEIQLLRQQLTSIGIDKFEELTPARLQHLEPDLSNFNNGLYLPEEGHIDNRQLLLTLQEYLNEKESFTIHYQTEISHLEPFVVNTLDRSYKFDWVIDCRGLGAKNDNNKIRGVRGETAWIKAHDINITRPVRLMHPRHQLYLVPKSNNIYVVGATSIESDSKNNITLRSALELLTTAYSLNSSFAEAEILDLQFGVRPALLDNLPKISYTQGLVCVHGLYRHGFLIAPAITTQVVAILNRSPILYPEIIDKL